MDSAVPLQHNAGERSAFGLTRSSKMPRSHRSGASSSAGLRTPSDRSIKSLENHIKAAQIERGMRNDIKHHKSDDPRQLAETPLQQSLRSESVLQTLSEQGQQLVIAQTKAFRLIDKTLRTRHRLDSEQQKLESCRRFERESSKDFMQAVRLAMLHSTVEAAFGELNAYYEQYQTDFENLEKQETLTGTVQTELSNLEYRLMSEETELVGPVRTFLSTLGVNLDGEHFIQSTASTPRPAPSDTPSLLRQYYESKGDVQIHQERLEELVIDHRDELEKRDFLTDRGDVVSPSDEEFKRNYEQQYGKIVADLKTAEAETTLLLDQCKTAGIEVPIVPALNINETATDEDIINYTSRPERSVAQAARYIPGAQNEIPSPLLFGSSGEILSSEPSLGKASGRSEGSQLSVRSWLNELPDGTFSGEADQRNEGQQMDTLEKGSKSAQSRKDSTAHVEEELRRHSAPLASISSSTDTMRTDLENANNIDKASQKTQSDKVRMR